MLISLIDKNSGGQKTNCKSEDGWSRSTRESKISKMRSLMNSMEGNPEVTKWEIRSRQEYIIQSTGGHFDLREKGSS